VDIMSCHWNIPYPHPRMSPFLYHRARANEQPLHIMTLILEKHWIWLWGLVWLSAIVVAIITQTVYGFTPSGGICYYPQSAGLYGELMQFIPRSVPRLFSCQFADIQGGSIHLYHPTVCSIIRIPKTTR
jgi:hypothetical protein